MNKTDGDLRAFVCISLSWGILWAVLTIIVGTGIGLIDPQDIGAGEEPIVLAPVVGFVGLLCGGVFSILLYIFERQKAVADISLVRVVLWGMFVSATLPLVMSKGVSELIVTVPLGALSAWISVTLLRTLSKSVRRTGSPERTTS